MSVMNRPDGGPQPRHAIERLGDAWVDPERQVVSGAFEVAERTPDRLVLARRAEARPRPGNVARLELHRRAEAEALGEYAEGGFDLVTVRYTPRMADLVPEDAMGARFGAAAWSSYLAFDHAHPVVGNEEFRRALAHAIDRDALEAVVPSNLVVARGGIVPPALQGHTPDIVLPFAPDVARAALERSGVGNVPLVVGGFETWFAPFLQTVAAMWEDVLGLPTEIRPWTLEQASAVGRLAELAPIYVTGWLPGYADPEYFLRLLFQSDSRTNEGGFSSPAFDGLIERARQERSDRERLELFHQADRMAVAERIAVVPLAYGRSTAFVQPWVRGWWEFGKSSSSFADLTVAPREG
jgi:peptide/nickel transport system substrate-binding protein/oligopeptide transport system substrate-binding protein